MDSDTKQPEDTKRDQFIASKEAELRKAEDGSVVLDLLQEQMNGSLKRIGGTTFKDDHAGYLYELGKLHQAQYLQNMLTREASKNVEQMRTIISAAESDE